MSIVVSAINDAVSNWRGQRARFLQRTLERLQAHPLYRSLAAPGKSPSYLSQAAFLEIYLDLIAPVSGLEGEGAQTKAG